MNLADFTRTELLLPQLAGRDLAAVVGELAAAMARAGVVPDAAELARRSLAREAQATTAWADRIAFPHARLPGVNRPCFALGRASPPLPWGEGGRPVEFVFLLAVPETDVMAYLSLLASLSRVEHDGQLSAALRAAGTGPELMAAIRSIEPAPPAGVGLQRG